MSPETTPSLSSAPTIRVDRGGGPAQLDLAEVLTRVARSLRALSSGLDEPWRLLVEDLVAPGLCSHPSPREVVHRAVP